ncbi:membrane protease YdiL (CAAX protease family) [Microbacterium sp. 1154]|uniref:CPBP family intramembrane glutamic endopeptidase n=1 Tax=Microbacterium sp. 1154 TaxID=2817733 RepID=UPI0028543804|nr:CPBP family intramembrane glutamic endopeptidase [Microbacterium sp. 1154]MDR6691215.1 membrane protease YdiL (CAAX protease family) [Microbacterium sp. 1154]
MFVAVAVGGGAGVVGALLVGWIQAPWASGVSLATLWLGMLGAVAFAFRRARPAGLLKLRATDLLWGVGLGLTLRVAQGLASQANSNPFPTSVSSTGGLSASELGNALAAGLAGPLIEEFFFRAVLLVLIYQAFRRSLGHVAAAVTATLASAGVFVCLHAVFASLTLADGLQLFLVGVACSALVLLTGRIWGAVFAHVVYNAILILLGILGGFVA